MLFLTLLNNWLRLLFSLAAANDTLRLIIALLIVPYVIAAAGDVASQIFVTVLVRNRQDAKTKRKKYYLYSIETFTMRVRLPFDAESS